MSFFTRLSNGWNLATVSFSTINRNRSLLLFPVFSGASLLLVMASFFGGGYFLFGEEIAALLDRNDRQGDLLAYGLIFIYYLINFFIIVFFNSALIHCAMRILNGEATSLSEGLSFAWSRVDKILGWTVVAATVGTLLKVLQSNGKIGEIVAALLGLAWSIMTFFVVPVLVYENKGVFDAIRQSGRLMREKWGESIGANASFGIFNLLGILAAVGLGLGLSAIHPVLGIAVGLATLLLVTTVIAAARTVFVAAVYNHVIGVPTGDFDGAMLDSSFIRKK
jgi:hypothetical protein